MLRESEAETEAGGRRSSSVVFAEEIWRKTVPPASTCAKRRHTAGPQRGDKGRTIPHCGGAFTATTAATTAFPSLPRPAGCEIDEGPAADQWPTNGRRPAGFVKGTSESYEHSTHVGWRSAPHLHTSLHAPRAHMSGWTAGIGRGLVARRNAADGLSGHT